ncbi:hypothetical protein HDU98_000197 [Podochytrium sp. JEL0797]|nr:hypothetical protein HDU98_000197 [Podochytrium sp. JEL0797]
MDDDQQFEDQLDPNEEDGDYGDEEDDLESDSIIDDEEDSPEDEDAESPAVVALGLPPADSIPASEEVAPPPPETEVEIDPSAMDVPVVVPEFDSNIALGAIEDAGEDDVLTEEEKFYFSGLFSIESAPVFKALDALAGNRNVQANAILNLKEKVRSLHTHLLSFGDYDKNLAKSTKQLAQEVTNQRMEIDRNESKQYTNNAEMGNLKRELVKLGNEVSLSAAREKKLASDISESMAQKLVLNADIDEIRKHKADMLEPQLIVSIKELKLDISQRRHQVENLEKDLEEKEITYEIVLGDKERLDIEKGKHAAALARASEMPQKIMKQSDILRDAISSLVIENVKQSTLAQQLDREIERLARHKREFEEIKLDQAAEYEERRAEIMDMERGCDEIFKDHEYAKEQLSIQRAERVRLEMSIRNAVTTNNKDHDILLRVVRDKEIQLKTHRRLELTVNNVKMSGPSIRKQLADFNRELELLQREETYQKRRMVEMRKSIDIGLYNFVNLSGAEKEEKEKMAAQLELNRRMERELEEVVERRTSLARQIETLTGDRDIKSRELIRIQNKYRLVNDDLQIKDLAISEAANKCEEPLARLKEFQTLYDIVKNERNKYVNQIQAAAQRAAEMKEKIKILSNEVEILRHEITHKDHELTKRRQDNTAAYAVRDAAKNDANKLLATYRERRDQIDQHLCSIETLNSVINSAEEDMVRLKERYERAVKDRNSVGIHLLDRNDELCILYERLNVLTGIMQNGETALTERKEEMRKLKIVKAEMQRRLELKKRLSGDADKVRQEAQQLQHELSKCIERSNELSAKMENPENPDRCNDLKGVDDNQSELLEKITRLELMLAEKEERLLEKDLLLEEVSTLTSRLKKQTIDGRMESYDVATRLNDLSKKIKHSTREMMAKVSELSMYQAMAMGLYQEKCEKEMLLEEARHRLSNGEVPMEEIEKEFLQKERMRKRRETDAMAIRERHEKESSPNFIDVDSDNFFVFNHVRTTAEPRPNAYVPDSSGVGELPIPKPYGAFAPFKPQEAGSQMRHIRPRRLLASMAHQQQHPPNGALPLSPQTSSLASSAAPPDRISTSLPPATSTNAPPQQAPLGSREISPLGAPASQNSGIVQGNKQKLSFLKEEASKSKGHFVGVCKLLHTFLNNPRAYDREFEVSLHSLISSPSLTTLAISLQHLCHLPYAEEEIIPLFAMFEVMARHLPHMSSYARARFMPRVTQLLNFVTAKSQSHQITLASPIVRWRENRQVAIMSGIPHNRALIYKNDVTARISLPTYPFPAGRIVKGISNLVDPVVLRKGLIQHDITFYVPPEYVRAVKERGAVPQSVMDDDVVYGVRFQCFATKNTRRTIVWPEELLSVFISGTAEPVRIPRKSKWMMVDDQSSDPATAKEVFPGKDFVASLNPYLVEGLNVMTILSNGQPLIERHTFLVDFVAFLSPARAKQEVKDGIWRFPYNLSIEFLNAILSKFVDPDGDIVMEESLDVSLLCPLSGKRILIPVRTQVLRFEQLAGCI